MQLWRTSVREFLRYFVSSLLIFSLPPASTLIFKTGKAIPIKTRSHFDERIFNKPFSESMSNISNKQASTLTFLIGSATLIIQILSHRIISSKLLNNYAFLVISLTMLGFAFSGVLLSQKLQKWLPKFREMLMLWICLFILTTLSSTVLFYHAPIGDPLFSTRLAFVTKLLSTLPYALLFAVPFTFSGLLLGSLLSNPNLPTRRIYFWDLFGSAVGAFVVIPAIGMWGAEHLLIIISVILLVTGFFCTRPTLKHVRVLTVFTLVTTVLCLIYSKECFSMRYPKNTLLGNGQAIVEYTKWDSVARIEVSRIPLGYPSRLRFPSLVGTNQKFLGHFKRILTQNNFAFTFAVDYDGNRESLIGIEETIYSSAYIASQENSPKVAIIGVGGGFDVLTAINFNAREITGIEVNRATIQILKKDYEQYFGHWVKDPRVELVYDDGRHYLATTSDKFDIIQLSGVDSYSGTPGAAHVFSESYLYTTEAVSLYLSRLTPNGILNIMRLEHTYPREMLRALATSIDALRNTGIENPAQHIVIVAQQDMCFVALLVKKSPFTQQEISKLANWASHNNHCKIVVDPLNTSAENLYQQFLNLKSSDLEEAFFDAYLFNIRPATDNKPFFFNFSRWSHLPLFLNFSRWATLPINFDTLVPVMEITLVIMFIFVGSAAIILVWWPVKNLARRTNVKPPKNYAVIFSGTAIGYMVIEVALLQKFGLYLGHPNFALSVVLAALLFATGLGSLCSKQLLVSLRKMRHIAYALTLVILLEALFVFPSLENLQFVAFWPRALIVVALIIPIGFLAGTFVPTAVDQMKSLAPNYIPWAWGLNGIFSVLAPVLSVAISMTWGIDALLLTAVPVYLLVGWWFPQAVRTT